MENNSDVNVQQISASEMICENLPSKSDDSPQLRSCQSDAQSTVTPESDAITNTSPIQTQETISMHNDNDEIEAPSQLEDDNASETSKEKTSAIKEVIDKVENLVLDEITEGCKEELQAEVSETSSKTVDVSSTGASSSNINREETSEYKIKQIRFNDTHMPIITQNENGPCPLIAIVNVLLLRSKINPFASKPVVTATELVDYIGHYLLSPKNYPSEGDQRDYEYNVDDAISKFPKLQTGIDVNVKFTGVKEFEYTSESIIFDLLNIPLYHGWLVDPQAKEVEQAVGKLSYNQLVEKIITNKSSNDSDVVNDALVAECFLEGTASQLTHYGLCELNNTMNSGELAVLFRNNHFSTIYKHKNELFQLVTDQGFLHESNVVWETLSNIDGDGQFVDASFVTVPPKPVPTGAVVNLADTVNSEEQIQQDYLVALSLQTEENRENEIDANWEEYKKKELHVNEDISDEELARRLQENENKHATADNGATTARKSAANSVAQGEQPRQRSPSDPQSGHSSKKKSDCTIL